MATLRIYPDCIQKSSVISRRGEFDDKKDDKANLVVLCPEDGKGKTPPYGGVFPGQFERFVLRRRVMWRNSSFWLLFAETSGCNVLQSHGRGHSGTACSPPPSGF